MRALVSMCTIMLATAASAQSYPFVGSWQSNGNGCGDNAYVFDAAGFRPVDGYCRFTKVTAADPTTFRYAARCDGSLGKYQTSGTLKMMGSNRMRLTDKDGPSDWTRC